jgi:hypothetical protein
LNTDIIESAALPSGAFKPDHHLDYRIGVTEKTIAGGIHEAHKIMYLLVRLHWRAAAGGMR